MKNTKRRINESCLVNSHISFREVLSLLISSHQSGTETSAKKLPRIVDTVFFRNDGLFDLNEDCHANENKDQGLFQPQISPLSSSNNCGEISRRPLILDWFYTSSQGSICRHKNPTSVALLHVDERFSKIVKACGGNGHKAFAIGFESAKDREEIDSSVGNNTDLIRNWRFNEQEFRNWVKDCTSGKDDHSVLSKIAAIQPYIQKNSSEQQSGVYRVTFRTADKNPPLVDGYGHDISQKSAIKIDVFILRENLNDHISSQNSVPLALESQVLSPFVETLLESDSLSESLCNSLKDSTLMLMENITAAVRKRLLKQRGKHEVSQQFNLKVESVTVDYVLDKNNILWISNISNTRTECIETCAQNSCNLITLNLRNKVPAEGTRKSTNDLKTMTLKRDDTADRENTVGSDAVPEKRSFKSLLKSVTVLEGRLDNKNQIVFQCTHMTDFNFLFNLL